MLGAPNISEPKARGSMLQNKNLSQSTQLNKEKIGFQRDLQAMAL